MSLSAVSEKVTLRKIPRIYWAVGALAVVQLFFSLVTDNLWLLRILLICNIYALYAASWDLLGGYTGQVSLGHALFFGGAGYISAILNLRFGVPLVPAMVAGVVSTVGFALLLGFPSLRVRGPYLSVMTLVTPLVFLALIYMYPEFLGGDCGFTGFENLAGGVFKHQFLITHGVVAL
jgi:branched-chain amino acid transport system permease protein